MNANAMAIGGATKPGQFDRKSCSSATTIDVVSLLRLRYHIGGCGLCISPFTRRLAPAPDPKMTRPSLQKEQLLDWCSSSAFQSRPIATAADHPPNLTHAPCAVRTYLTVMHPSVRDPPRTPTALLERDRSSQRDGPRRPKPSSVFGDSGQIGFVEQIVRNQ